MDKKELDSYVEDKIEVMQLSFRETQQPLNNEEMEEFIKMYPDIARMIMNNNLNANNDLKNSNHMQESIKECQIEINGNDDNEDNVINSSRKNLIIDDEVDNNNNKNNNNILVCSTICSPLKRKNFALLFPMSIIRFKPVSVKLFAKILKIIHIFK